MGHNKDILWKGLLEWGFGDLLRLVFPDADKLFDWGIPVTFMDKELAALDPRSEETMTVRAVDKLASVQVRKEKTPALVHLEVQGGTDREGGGLFGAATFS